MDGVAAGNESLDWLLGQMAVSQLDHQMPILQIKRITLTNKTAC